MEIDIYSQTGAVVEKMALPKEIFETPVKQGLIHRALVMQLANQRRPIAHTMKRDERSGSTKKMYRQKGTGQARQGTRRSPVHRKGGVVFGPRNSRNFEKSMNKQERRLALFSALSARAQEASIVGLDKYDGKISTRAFADFLAKLPAAKNVLVVVPEKNELLQKSTRNLPTVKTVLVNYLNVKDVLHHQQLLFLKEAVSKLSATFLK